MSSSFTDLLWLLQINCPDLISGQVDIFRRACAGHRDGSHGQQLTAREDVPAGLVYNQIKADLIPIKFLYVHRPDNLFILAVTLIQTLSLNSISLQHNICLPLIALSYFFKT